MPATLDQQLVVAVSSRALFDLDHSHALFEDQGLQRYSAYQIAHEDVPLAPGVGYGLIKRLLELRDPQTQTPLVEVILISKNDPNTGLRVFNAIEALGLPIKRAVFTNGRAAHPYLAAFNVDLFLSANSQDVRLALAQGHASATLLTGLNQPTDDNPEVRIAFDGDAVLFSDESERIYQEHGLDAFQANELAHSEVPLAPGPFQRFLSLIHQIQVSYQHTDQRPIRTALVTARSAPAHKRVIKTLRHWGVQIDEAFFLGGLDKSPVLEQFRPHIFFDDQTTFCQQAAKVVPTGHVPAGIKNL